MGIWRVLTATVYCDTCERAIASLEFDAADEPNIERIKVWCAECRKIKSKPDPNMLLCGRVESSNKETK